MLAKYMRFRVLNDTDQTLTYANDARVEVTYIGWKYTNGVLVYASEVKQNTDFLNTGETIAADGEAEGAVIDNSSNLYAGMHGTFRVIADQTSTDGTVYLFKEESTDNSVWPSDAADFDINLHMDFVAAIPFSTDAADEDAMVNFRI